MKRWGATSLSCRCAEMCQLPNQKRPHLTRKAMTRSESSRALARWDAATPAGRRVKETLAVACNMVAEGVAELWDGRNRSRRSD